VKKTLFRSFFPFRAFFSQPRWPECLRIHESPYLLSSRHDSWLATLFIFLFSACFRSGVFFPPRRGPENTLSLNPPPWMIADLLHLMSPLHCSRQPLRSLSLTIGSAFLVRSGGTFFFFEGVYHPTKCFFDVALCFDSIIKPMTIIQALPRPALSRQSAPRFSDWIVVSLSPPLRERTFRGAANSSKGFFHRARLLRGPTPQSLGGPRWPGSHSED